MSEFMEGVDLIGKKVSRLAQTYAVVARANGRSGEERRWLDLIAALESDLAILHRENDRVDLSDYADDYIAQDHEDNR